MKENKELETRTMGTREMVETAMELVRLNKNSTWAELARKNKNKFKYN